MEAVRRFLFCGEAVAIGGNVRLPRSVRIPGQCSLALPSSGGTARTRLSKGSYGSLLNFHSASASVAGERFETGGNIARSAVVAVVKGLTVHSGNRKLKAATVAVTLVSDHPDSDGEPSIRAEHLELRGFSIDGFPLEVVFSDFLNRFPTKKQLTQAFRAERDLFDTFDRCLFTAPGWRAPRGRRVAPEKAGTLCGTVVREIRWKRRVHPDAVIEGNRIRVPGLGTVFLGEVFLTSLERRFSMMRIQLDGASPGEVEVCEARNNGGTWPP